MKMVVAIDSDLQTILHVKARVGGETVIENPNQ